MDGPIAMTDILKRPVFRNSRVLAGAAGLERPVTWVHVLEQPQAATLIRGGELILSTGIGFAQRKNGFQRFVQQLIEAGAAGLCLELGTAVSDVPDSVLATADEHGFPILVFAQQVHFVDITQDVHSLIVRRHHQLVEGLESLSKQLHHLTVAGQGSHRMLGLIHEATGCPVMYHRFGAKLTLVGPGADKAGAMAAEWLSQFSGDQPTLIEPTVIDLPDDCRSLRQFGEAMLAQSVTVLGIPRGTVALVASVHRLDEYLRLLLDRVTSALSLDEYRRMSIEERQLFSEQDWVERLTYAESSSAPFDLAASDRRTRRFCAAVISCPPPAQAGEPEGAGADRGAGVAGAGRGDEGTAGSGRGAIADAAIDADVDSDANDWIARKADLAMIARHAFSRQGFRPYLSVRRDTIIAVLEFDAAGSPIKPKLLAAIERLRQAFDRSALTARIEVGVGHEVSADDIRDSYHTAVIAWKIRSGQMDRPVLFYDEAGVYRWLHWLDMDDTAQDLALADLEPILAYDRKHASDLFRTLKAYLDHDRSIQKTAEHLFIHRQTLYHRLKQLDRLLQTDLQDPIQRLGLHLAVYYHLHATE